MFLKLLIAVWLSLSIVSSGAASAQATDTVVVTGKVTDRDGKPITKCDIFFNKEKWITDSSINAKCDASGSYRIEIPKGHYNSIYICDEDKYGKTALEFWGWNLDFHKNRTLDAAFDKLEVFSLAAWNSNGGANSIFASFRPMSVEKTKSPKIHILEKLGPEATVFDITPNIDMNSVTAKVDGIPVKVKSLQWIYEQSDSCTGIAQSGFCYMPVAIIQLARPTLEEGTHLLRIRIMDKDTGAMGEGVTEFTSNKAGFGF